MSVTTFSRALTWVRERFFPPACFVCSRLLDLYDGKERTSALCRECAARWEKEKQETCPICALPIASCECMNEEMQKMGCRHLRRLVYYRKGVGDPVQNRLIYRFKYRRSRRTAEFLARELLPALASLMEEEGMTPENTLLVPIPRSRAAYLEHGTDQAEALAGALSRVSGIPMRRIFLHRGGKAPMQKELSAEERMKNAARAYRLQRGVSVKGYHVVLLDDIVTTGATMCACARRIRRRGVLGIHCLAIASDDL